MKIGTVITIWMEEVTLGRCYCIRLPIKGGFSSGYASDVRLVGTGVLASGIL